MNSGTGKFFLRPAQEAIDVDDIVDVTGDEHDVTQSRSETAEISNAPSSSPSEDENVAEVNRGCLDDRLRWNQKGYLLGIFRAEEGSDSGHSERVPVYC